MGISWGVVGEEHWNNPPWDYKLQYGRFLEQHFFIQQAPPPDEESGVVEPGHVLKYSAYKNLASLAEKRGQWEKSIDAYLQVGACAFKHVHACKLYNINHIMDLVLL